MKIQYIKNTFFCLFFLSTSFFYLGCNLPIAEIRTPTIKDNFGKLLTTYSFSIQGESFDYRNEESSKFIAPFVTDPYSYSYKSKLEVADDGSYAIAWYDFSTKKIRAIIANSENIVVDNSSFVVPGAEEQCDFLGDFLRLPNGDFVVAYVNKPNSVHGGTVNIVKIKSDYNIEFNKNLFSGDLLTPDAPPNPKPFSLHSPLYKGSLSLSSGTFANDEIIACQFSYAYREKNSTVDVIKDSLVIINSSDGSVNEFPIDFESSGSGSHYMKLFNDGESICSFEIDTENAGVFFQKISSQANRYKIHPIRENSDETNLQFQMGDALRDKENIYMFIASTSLQYDLSNNNLLDEPTPRRNAIVYFFNGQTGIMTNVRKLTSVELENVVNPVMGTSTRNFNEYFLGWNLLDASGNVRVVFMRINRDIPQPTIIKSETIPEEIILEPTSKFVSFPNGDIGFIVTFSKEIKLYRVSYQ